MFRIIFLIIFTFTFPCISAETGNLVLKHVNWSFSGPLGKFDKASMQRGFQTYKQVCASCHSLNYVAFRNLKDLGYNQNEIIFVSKSNKKLSFFERFFQLFS